MSDDTIVVEVERTQTVEIIAEGPQGPPGPSGSGGGSDAVSSVFGRTGAIAAQSGDYALAQIGGLPAVVAALEAEIAAKQSAGTAATDIELAAEATARANADALLLAKSGGTMTGALTLQGNPGSNLGAAPKQYVDSSIASLINGAPGTLDTLGEIAAALATDAGIIEALQASIAGALQSSRNLEDLTSAAAARNHLGLESAAVHPASDFDLAGAANTEKVRAEGVEANKQALNANLTAIAVLSTQAFGRSLLTKSTATEVREALGLGSAALSATTAFDVAGAAVSEEERAKKAEAALVRPQIQVASLAASLAAIKEQTALQNITGLGVEVGASATEVWRVTWWMLVEAPNAEMDVKFGLTFPTATTIRWGAPGSTGLNGWSAVQASGSPGTISTESAVLAYGSRVGTIGVSITALIFGGGTAGSVQLQYAQNTSNGGNLQVLKGSTMEALKISA